MRWDKCDTTGPSGCAYELVHGENITSLSMIGVIDSCMILIVPTFSDPQRKKRYDRLNSHRTVCSKAWATFLRFTVSIVFVTVTK